MTLMEALKIMSELHEHPGAERAVHNQPQWVASYTVHGISADPWTSIYPKINRCFSPCFATRENCEAAIRTVGEQRIRRAMEWLAGVE